MSAADSDDGGWVTVQRRGKAAPERGASAHDGPDRAPLRALNAAAGADARGAAATPGSCACAPHAAQAAAAAGAASMGTLPGGAPGAAGAAVALRAAPPALARLAPRSGGPAHLEAAAFPALAPPGGPLTANKGPVSRSGVLGAPGARLRCVACSPGVLCVPHRHARDAAERAAVAARLAASAPSSPTSGSPRARSSSPDENADARGGAQLVALTAAERQLVLAAAYKPRRRDEGDLLALHDSSDGSSSSDDGSAPTLKLDTDWSGQKRNLRTREKALRRAGWLPRPGPVGEHPQWRRVLPWSSKPQCMTIPGSPSDCRHWDNQTAQLKRHDSDAADLLRKLQVEQGQ